MAKSVTATTAIATILVALATLPFAWGQERDAATRGSQVQAPAAQATPGITTLPNIMFGVDPDGTVRTTTIRLTNRTTGAHNQLITIDDLQGQRSGANVTPAPSALCISGAAGQVVYFTAPTAQSRITLNGVTFTSPTSANQAIVQSLVAADGLPVITGYAEVRHWTVGGKLIPTDTQIIYDPSTATSAGSALVIMADIGTGEETNLFISNLSGSAVQTTMALYNGDNASYLINGVPRTPIAVIPLTIPPTPRVAVSLGRGRGVMDELLPRRPLPARGVVINVSDFFAGSPGLVKYLADHNGQLTDGLITVVADDPAQIFGLTARSVVAAGDNEVSAPKPTFALAQ